MKKLSDLIPNWEDVLRLEPEQLAGILLEILLVLRPLSQGRQRAGGT